MAAALFFTALRVLIPLPLRPHAFYAEVRGYGMIRIRRKIAGNSSQPLTAAVFEDSSFQVERKVGYSGKFGE